MSATNKRPTAVNLVATMEEKSQRQPSEGVPACGGQFCHLIKVFHPTRDIVCKGATQTQDSKARTLKSDVEYQYVSNAKEVTRSQQRDRAACILRRLLTQKELTMLEESASTLQLRIGNKLNPAVFRMIDMESIQLARKEHRLALSHLRDAEEALGGIEEHRDQVVIDPPSVVLADGVRKASEKDVKVQVCDVCYHVYQLLEKVRRLILNHRHETNDIPVGDENVEQSPENDERQKQVHDKLGPQHLNTFEVATHRSSFTDRSKKASTRMRANRGSYHGESSVPVAPRQNRTVSARSKILVCHKDARTSKKAREILENKGFVVSVAKEVSEGTLQKEDSFDAFVVGGGSRSKEEITKWLRAQKVVRFADAPLPIVSINDSVAADPTNEQGRTIFTVNPTELDTSLAETVLKALGRVDGEKSERSNTQCKPRKRRHKSREASKDAKGPSAKKGQSADKYAVQHGRKVSGWFRFNECTVCPFVVMHGGEGFPSVVRSIEESTELNTIFNLVVCHDIFDTHERMEIFLQPIVSRYPGMQVLLWNYPGQAFTEFSDEEVLNNEFHACCLDGLLRHLGRDGTGQFDTGHPFYILGYGSGAAIASLYASTYDQPHLRGLVFVNGVSFVDSHYASVLQDCRNVFSCCPEARPDLPVYFYARFLFSTQYLNQISASLALNLYSAVHNPISLRGRIRLCLGALRHIDVRPLLYKIGKPVVVVYGKDSMIVKMDHINAFVDAYRGDRPPCTSINEALIGEKSNIVTVAFSGGHELFQEKKKSLSTLIEQLLVGYHEVNDDPSCLLDMDCVGLDVRKGDSVTLQRSSFEDHYIDSVIGRHGIRASTNAATNAGDDLRGDPAKLLIPETPAQLSSWEDFRKTRLTQQGNNCQQLKNPMKKQKWHRKTRGEGNGPTWLTLDPKSSLFDRQERLRKRPLSPSLKDVVAEYPEVKEYMRWRLRRNTTRLAKLDHAARCIQGAARCMTARSALLSLMLHAAALLIQRCYRGMRGRKRHWEKRRSLISMMFVQRALRGFICRSLTYRRRKMRELQVKLARRWRGKSARQVCRLLLIEMARLSTKIQCLWRRATARSIRNVLWIRKLSCIVLQRVFRGYLGRCKAQKEQKKYIFSRSHSSGIELAHQMLTEYKLRATKLHSEVALLNKEKSSYDEQIDAALNDISKCEQGVRNLEHQMHELTLLEKDAAGMLPGKVKTEVREQKIRLDKEFSEALTRISDRREYLQQIEENIGKVEASRKEKHDELQKLERKLVVLLEAQQNELNAIRRHQEKGQGHLLRTVKMDRSDEQSDTSAFAEGAKTGYRTGPSEKERQEAAQLMESTEAMMKFGFMGMSMSYLSSLNLMKAAKKVAAQDTVLEAAFRANQATLSAGDNSGFRVHSIATSSSASTPSLDWKVHDVLEWLSSLGLGQYWDAFQDGAVDGRFLFALTDEDLHNTLGVEHKLHRKKILLAIEQLKKGNRHSDVTVAPGVPRVALDATFSNVPHSSGLNALVDPDAGAFGLSGTGKKLTQPMKDDSVPRSDLQPAFAGTRTDPPILDIEDVFSWARHQKLETLQNALRHIPNKLYDESNTRVQFVEDYGTAYIEAYDKAKFTMNKTDDHGNTLLHVAAQNGNIKIAKLLIQKGCNPNHQNRQGNTPGHFSMAYQFFDFATWLFKADGGGANDLILNSFGLGPYDGIERE